MKAFYKIVAALMALAVIPVLIFSPVIYYRLQSTAMQALLTLGKLKNSEVVNELLESYDTVPSAIADSVSVKDAYSTLTSLGNIAGDSEEVNNSAAEAFKTPLITTAVIGVMLMICAIVTAVMAIISKNNRNAIYGSLAGIGLSVMFMFSFESLVAPFMSGEVNIATFINTWWASLVAQVEELSLSSTFYIIPALFVAVIAWTVIYNYTLPDEEKKARKIMLGEDE